MRQFSDNVFVAAWQRQDGRCAVCGAPLGRDDAYDAHHQVPVAAGGANSLENCLLVCEDCHRDLHRGARHGQVTYTDSFFRYKYG